MESILVTGGAGYIGSHTCLDLLEKGYSLIVIDSNINSSKRSLKQIINIGNLLGQDFKERIFFIKGDIRNEKLLNDIFIKAENSNKKVYSVIHFAGLKSVSESVQDPLSYWDNNLIGTINLLKTMKKNNCKTLVFSSSATVYQNTNIPIKEEMKKSPSNPYGQTKLTIETLLSDIYESDSNWRIANLRYFNPIGAHDSGLIGEDFLNEPTNIFPIICQVANGFREKIDIFGNDWPTKDGTCIRDYIHVMDLAKAHVASLDYLMNGSPKLLNLNIGTGKGISVLNLIKEFEIINKCKIDYKFVNRRVGDLPQIVANNSLSLSLLNWKPLKDISDMCADGWKWAKTNPNGYKKINFSNENISIKKLL